MSKLRISTIFLIMGIFISFCYLLDSIYIVHKRHHEATDHILSKLIEQLHLNSNSIVNEYQKELDENFNKLLSIDYDSFSSESNHSLVELSTIDVAYIINKKSNHIKTIIHNPNLSNNDFNVGSLTQHWQTVQSHFNDKTKSYFLKKEIINNSDNILIAGALIDTKNSVVNNLYSSLNVFCLALVINNNITNINHSKECKDETKQHMTGKLIQSINHPDLVFSLKPISTNENFHNVDIVLVKQRKDSGLSLSKNFSRDLQSWFLITVILLTIILWLRKWIETKSNTFIHQATKAINTGTPLTNIKSGVYEIDHISSQLNLLIKEQVAANNKLNSANLNAHDALKAKSTFVANISHEVRTPLNAILGMTELCLDEPMNDSSKHYIESINYSAFQLMRIINDILDFSKVESNKFSLVEEPINFTSITTLLDAYFLDLATRKGIKFKISIDENIPNQLRGDQGRLVQILSNLCSNAIKFTHKGSVLLTVRCVAEFKDTASLEFSVSDTGNGICEENLKKIFNSFEQIDNITDSNLYEGTGLGLSITKELISFMGGEIKVASKVDSGSTFYFTIDFYRPMISLFPKKSQLLNAEPSVLRGKHVLIAEDDKINREILRSTLMKKGMTVDLAENGEQAIQKCLSKENQFDLVIMDIQMPKKNGLDACMEIRKEFTKIQLPIIALSAFSDKESVDRSYNAGMTAHFSKPVVPSQLVLSLAIELSKHSTIEDIEALQSIQFENAMSSVDGNVELYTQLLSNFIHHYTSKQNSKYINIEEYTEEELIIYFENLLFHAKALFLDRIYNNTQSFLFSLKAEDQRNDEELTRIGSEIAENFFSLQVIANGLGNEQFTPEQLKK